MGNKETKSGVNIGSGRSERGPAACSSKKALTSCMATLADMANTGFDGRMPESFAGPGKIDGDMSPRTFHRLSARLKHKLEKQVPTSEDARKQLELLNGLLSSDDSSDWASMRQWMVWCMHENVLSFDEEDFEAESVLPRAVSAMSISPRRRLSRQASVDHALSGAKMLGRQNCLDIPHDPRMSQQSSLESNGET